MATIRSYTSLEQSKKLAKILPTESADMYYPVMEDNIPCKRAYPKDGDYLPGEDIECWSLAALLEILPSHFYDETGRKSFGLDKGDHTYGVFYESKNAFIQTTADNPVDACVAMIERLHEQKLL